MSKILVGDLRRLQNNLDKTVKCELDDGLILEIETYLPVLDKMTMARIVFESSIDEDSTLQVVDENIMDIVFKVSVVSQYTNVSLPKDSIDAYNLIEELGIYDRIAEEIPREIDMLQDVLWNHISEHDKAYERKNSVPNIIKSISEDLLKRLPNEEGMSEMMEGINEQLDGFDTDKLEFIKDFVAKNSGE